MHDDPLHDPELAAWAASFGLQREAVAALTSLLTRRTAATGRPAGTPLPPKAASTLAERFELGPVIGTGGMSEVRRAHDRLLDRAVALKIALEPSDIENARFLAEARVAADLQHPGILPVYDSGALPDGRRWVAMREVQGRPLNTLLAVAAEDPDPGTALRRLVAIWVRVCEAVGFAHARGVVHRDLKPSNVMVGHFGEVIVLDWGIACRVGGGAGEVVGTPGYMSPEQEAGEAIGTESDVFALGVLLGGVLAAVAAEPGELRALRDDCLRPDPAARPASASVIAAVAAGWLDGARRRADAQRRLDEARRLGHEAGALRARAARLDDEAAALLGDLPTHASTATKAPGWALEDEATALRRRANTLRVDLEQQLHTALMRAPDLAEARAMLADYYRDRVVEAEAARDTGGVAEYEARLRAADEGAHRDFLDGRGRLSLATTPAGAEVWCAPYVAEQRRLVVGPERLLGRTPLHAVELARGSHRLRLEAPGRVTVIHPIHLERGEHWRGRPPHDAREAPWPVPMPPADAMRAEWCYVPPGWFYSGGDREAVDGAPRRRIWVDGFIIERDPLTYATLIEALNRMVDAGERALAEQIAPPPVDRGGGGSDGDLSVERTPSGRFRLDVIGDHPHAAAWPVSHLSWHAAHAWAGWRRAQSGLPWRLPHDLEREKAARGADGRWLPWGDFFDPTWAVVLGSRPGRPLRRAVDEVADDVSPYGVRGLAGNMRDWCLNGYHRRGLPPGVDRLVVRLDDEARDGAAGSLRMIRGGGYAAKPEACRPAGRFATPPDVRLYFGGVRLVCPYPFDPGQSDES